MEKIKEGQEKSKGDIRYDRQERIIGVEAMKALKSSKVLLCGLSGLGVEVAKNIILMGVQNLVLYDPKPTSYHDLSSQFFLTEESIGKNRVSESIAKLKELNEDCTITQHSSETLSEEFLSQFSVVVFTDNLFTELKDTAELCHKKGIVFISGIAAGLCSAAFVDVGNFKSLDIGMEENNGIISNIIMSQNMGVLNDVDQNDYPIVEIVDLSKVEKSDKITIIPDGSAIIDITDEENPNPHTMMDGNEVRFHSVGGIEELNDGIPRKIYRIDAQRFYVTGLTKNEKYTTGGYYESVPQTEEFKMVSLSENLEKPNYQWINFSRETLLHLGFLTLGKFFEETKRYPKPYNEEDGKLFIKLSKEINEGDKYLESVFVDEEYLLKFCYTSSGNLNPTVTFLGAAVAQEVLKSITKKYMPINQLYYYTMLESVNDPMPTEDDCKPIESRYDGQIAVFGNKFQKKLGNSKSFIVGAGALGCEYIKNYAMMGISCGPKGKTYVTDLDTIDVSNLSRQFLFRKEHVGSMKSTVACDAAKIMNNCFNVFALQDRVGPETENVFNDKFWDGLDFVTNALDNVQARLYVDSRCIFYCKPLLESGTLGTLANSQVIIPNKTKSYASTKDAPQKALPQCTVHTFPNLIQHTIIWSRQLFDSFFTSSVKSAFSYLSNPEEFISKNESDLFVLESIWYKLTKRPNSFDECIEWARSKFEEIFIHLIKDILAKYPVDHKTESGGAFWSGNKKCPKILSFDFKEFSHKQFIYSASKLYSDVYQIEIPKDYNEKKYEEICEKTKLPIYKMKKVVTGNEEEEEQQEEQQKEESKEEKEKRENYYKMIKDDLKNIEKFKDFKVNPVDFEKDLDENFHMDFITSASNIRASAYGIPEADKHKTKGIAGNIIPAMITTTAMVTGLIGNETYKILQNKEIDYFRNSYISLAFNSVQQSTPPPCEKEFLGKFTLWDRFDISEGEDISLGKLINILKERYSLDVIMLVYGGNPIYVDMNKNDQLLAAPVGKLVQAFLGKKFDSNKKYLEFSCSATYESKPVTALPTIRYQFKYYQNDKKKVIRKK
eukprot:gene7198-11514_t